MTTPTKRVAWVTGASRGIGAEIAKRLAHDGFEVVINFSSSETKAREVFDAIISKGGKAHLSQFDVSNPTKAAEAFDRIAKEVGPAHVLINNAGISVDSLLMRAKDDDIEKVLNIDLKGAIYCAREASKQMFRGRIAGSIIQISSVIGQSGNAGQSVYASAKAGLIGFTKSLAQELASRQIRVNAITPGFIETEMTGALSDVQKDAILKNIPLGSLGQAVDVANAVSFLVSEQSRYITGQIIAVNGGMYM